LYVSVVLEHVYIMSPYKTDMLSRNDSTVVIITEVYFNRQCTSFC